MVATKEAKYTVFNRIIEELKKSDANNLKQPHTLGRYLQDGLTTAALCGAGSFYMLILMSCSRIRPEVRKLNGPMCGRVAKLIRCPPDTAIGRKVTRHIIPAVAHLRQLYPISLKMILPLESLGLERLTDSINCQDIRSCDDIFDTFQYNDFVKERDWGAWQLAAIPLAPKGTWNLDILKMLLPEPFLSYNLNSSLINSQDLICIKTNYKPSLNSKKIYPKEAQARFEFTEKQRKAANMAMRPKDLQDFIKQFPEQLKTGKRARRTQYTRLDADLIHGKILKIQDVNEDLLALIIANMPETLRRDLVDVIDSIFEGRFTTADTHRAGSTHVFDSIHFSYYNRYSKRGDAVSPDQDPAGTLPNGRRHNTSTFVPRAAKELEGHYEEYQLLHEALEPVFIWIQSLLESILPEHVDVLKLYLEVLPCQQTSPVYPFTGYVVNINVITKIHRDPNDKDICLVIVISSDCEGGELCLMEPGLVLALRNGDAVVFPSCKISHFNQHYKGRRASLVLQSDRWLNGWLNDANGWDGNIHIRLCSSKEVGL